MTEEMNLGRGSPQMIAKDDAHYSPCEAYEAIIDVHEAEVGCWYPDVQDVDDELVARIQTHSAR